jgi:hypothetical protein
LLERVWLGRVFIFNFFYTSCLQVKLVQGRHFQSAGEKAHALDLGKIT